MPEEQCPFHRPLIAPEPGVREAAAPGAPRMLLREARVWGPPERSGAGRLMSRVEEAQRAPHPLCARGMGRSGRGLGAGWGWRQRQLPTYLLGARRGGLGPASFRLLQRAKHAPRQPHPFRLSTATFKLSLKTWGAPRRSGASPRRSSQPGEGAKAERLGGASGRETRGRGARDPRDPSPPAQATALLPRSKLTQLPTARRSAWSGQAGNASP